MSGVPSWRGVIANLERSTTRRGRTEIGRFRIEGHRLHERALRAGRRIEAVVVAESARTASAPRTARLLADLSESGTVIHFVPDDEVERLTGGRGLGPFVGLMPLTEPPHLDQVLEASPGATLLVGVEIEDPGNVGALTRTAHASGAAAFVGVGTSDPFHPRAVQTSMGSLMRLAVLERSDLESLVRELHAANVCCVGAVTREATPLPRASLSEGPLALFVGSEAFGMDRRSRALLDEEVSVPMPEDVDSFSVNAAAAILLYELSRRRFSHGSSGVACWLVSGKVQGVGFRHHVQQAARRHGVRGDVRNLPDGRVEVRAVGSAAELDALLREIRLGPRWARVDAVDEHEMDAAVTDFEAFSVRF